MADELEEVVVAPKSRCGRPIATSVKPASKFAWNNVGLSALVKDPKDKKTIIEKHLISEMSGCVLAGEVIGVILAFKISKDRLWVAREQASRLFSTHWLEELGQEAIWSVIYWSMEYLEATAHGKSNAPTSSKTILCFAIYQYLRPSVILQCFVFPHR